MARTTHETRFLLTAKDKTNLALKGARANIRSVGQAVTGLHTQILALAGIGGLGAMLSGIIRTNSEMQTLKTSLKTVTGSTEAANAAFSRLEQFAIETPFDLNEWTEGFIKMKALGLDPSEAALTSYGNTASAMGKSLTQMIEAVADASTGEFERLKEFGIRASKQGDQIEFTFQGVTTTVGNSAAEIEKYLQSIGNTQFAGAMDEQAKNLTAAFSNLRQAFASLAVKIGEAGLNDMVRDITLSITDFTNSVSTGGTSSIVAFFKGLKSVLESVWWLMSNIVDAAATVTSSVGKMFIPDSGIGNMAPAVPGGYQLGDLNRSNANADYLATLKAIDAKYGQNDEKAKQQRDQTNNTLREIAERLRQQDNVAVAG